MPAKSTARKPLEGNKKSRVYEILEDRIVANQLKPQEYLNEQSLCKEFGISKTPVREALQRLEHKKLVVVVPNKGSFVAPIGLDMIREVFEAREIVECAAARIAATLDDREPFRIMLDSHESLLVSPDDELRGKLLSGYQIHTFIVESIGNSFLTEYYRTLLAHIVRIRVFFLARFEIGRLRQTTDEHRSILKAIVDGDPDRAEAAMREHLQLSQLHINQTSLRSRVSA